MKTLGLILAILLSLLAPAAAAAQTVTFTDIGAGLPGVSKSSAAWGDYDNDGDLDLLLMGRDASWNPLARIYRNNGDGTFTDLAAGLPGVGDGSAAWGDYDNDGDLDVLLTGMDASSNPLARIYRNNGDGTFTDLVAGFPGVGYGSAAWGDCDNDGDLDVVLSGWSSGSGDITRVYRNNGNGTFTDLVAGLPGAHYGSVALADCDNDGDLDLLLTGETPMGPIARVYRNSGGAFADTIGALPGVSYGAGVWGDYNSDGDPDILLTGRDSYYAPLARVYRNNGDGTFTDIAATIEGVYNSSAAWGDADNDGDLDLLLAGSTWQGPITRVYRNSGGAFADTIGALHRIEGSVAWGDYDNDGDLDLLLAGQDNMGGYAGVCRSDGAPANTSPSSPGGLTSQVVGQQVTLSWTAATDAQTSSAGLSYNLRIGTTPGGSQIASGMADWVSGYRRVVQRGNAQQRTSWTVKLPAPGQYFWSVQAVDGASAGSAFAAEGSFRAITFTDIGAGLPGVYAGSTAWGDYDNDGDLDVLLTGHTPPSATISRIYRNNGNGTFTDIGAGLPGVYNGYAAWGDYDHDGDLDFVMVGSPWSGDLVARVYHNNGNGTFTDIGAGLPGMYLGTAAWGDYDNDGDLDLLLSGDTRSGIVTRIYRNDAGVFSDIGAGLPDVAASVAWGDYDNDGDLDILLAGSCGLPCVVTRIYRNDGGVFHDIGAGLPGVYDESVAWGDYDNDGDLDVLLTGNPNGGHLTRVYRNDGGVFHDIGAGLPGVQAGRGAWGDYDNDGRLDIALSGYSVGLGYICRIYRNRGDDTFADIGAGLPGVNGASVAWGDYDNDGDLDLVMTGLAGSTYYARIYRNDGAPTNTLPAAPGALSAQVEAGGVALTWSASTDAQTPAPGLSYNLRIGTAPGGNEIASAMASSASGYRRVPELGNAQQNTSRSVKLSASGVYYWSVQAIDGAWSGSPFSPEMSYFYTPPAAIESVADVPNDQGGWVRLTVAAAALDTAAAPPYPLASYNVWQRIDDSGLLAQANAEGRASPAGMPKAPAGASLAQKPAPPPGLAAIEWHGRWFVRGGAGARLALTSDAGAVFPPGTWELVGSFAAMQQSQYTYRAPTLADSPAVSVYVVSAHTTTPALWVLSLPDSGRSVDNIPPGVPQGFLVTGNPGGGLRLEWQPSAAEDFQYFRIYRGSVPEFPIGPGSLVHSTAERSWADLAPGGGAVYYKLTALDHAGNESAPTTCSAVLGVEGKADVPAQFALHRNAPNPFAGITRVRFDLPRAEAVRLEVLDVQGRLVRVLASGPFTAGRYQVEWDGRDSQGHRLGAGTYSCRLRAGSFKATRRLVLIH